MYSEGARVEKKISSFSNKLFKRQSEIRKNLYEKGNKRANIVTD